MAWKLLVETITTASDGSATQLFDVTSGYVHSIRVVDTDITNTANVTITVERTGQNILIDGDFGATQTFYPRTLEQLDTDGSNLSTHTRVALANDRVKLVLAAGGDTKSAIVYIVIADG